MADDPHHIEWDYTTCFVRYNLGKMKNITVFIMKYEITQVITIFKVVSVFMLGGVCKMKIF